MHHRSLLSPSDYMHFPILAVHICLLLMTNARAVIGSNIKDGRGIMHQRLAKGQPTFDYKATG